MSRRAVTVLLLILTTTVPAHGMFQKLKNVGAKLGFGTMLKCAWNNKGKVIGFGVGSVAFLGTVFGAYKLGQAQEREKFESWIKEAIGQKDSKPPIFCWERRLIEQKQKVELLDRVKKKLKEEVFLDDVPKDFNIKNIDEFVFDSRGTSEDKDEKIFKILNPEKVYNYDTLEKGWHKKLVSKVKYQDLRNRLKNTEIELNNFKLKKKTKFLQDQLFQSGNGGNGRPQSVSLKKFNKNNKNNKFKMLEINGNK